MIKINCKLILTLKDPDRTLKATELDNLGYVKAKVENNRYVAELNSNSPGTLINTIEDLFSAIKLAEEIEKL